MLTILPEQLTKQLFTFLFYLMTYTIKNNFYLPNDTFSIQFILFATCLKLCYKSVGLTTQPQFHLPRTSVELSIDQRSDYKLDVVGMYGSISFSKGSEVFRLC